MNPGNKTFQQLHNEQEEAREKAKASVNAAPGTEQPKQPVPEQPRPKPVTGMSSKPKP